MKTIRIFSIIILSLSLIVSCKKEKAQSENTKNSSNEEKLSLPKTEESSDRWITAKGGLRVRKSADLKAEKIGLIPEGEKVKFLQDVGDEITISGETGKWTEIEFTNSKTSILEKGWVFGGFLSLEEPKVAIGDVEVKDGCYQFNKDNFPSGLITGCWGDTCSRVKSFGKYSKEELDNYFDQGQFYAVFLEKGEMILASHSRREGNDIRDVTWEKKESSILIKGEYMDGSVKRPPEIMIGKERQWEAEITKKYGDVKFYIPFEAILRIDSEGKPKLSRESKDTSKYKEERNKLKPDDLISDECIHPL